MLTPNSLYPGAKVAVLCPSFAVSEERLAPAIEDIRAFGVEPVVYPSCYEANHHGYFSADDGQRAKELQDAFADPSIQGIWCLRGGYGAGRLLPLLNWREIARHPKLFCGFSDITALHIVLNQYCHLITYHTPMLGGEQRRPADDFTTTYLRRALFGALTGPLPLDGQAETLSGGRARGVLCGGNLSLVCDSLGTPWEINTRGKILFLEDTGEAIHRLDAMLTQLRNAGKFRDCAGILLGGWTDCAPQNPERSLTLDDLFRELILPTGKPTLSHLPAGHLSTTMSLPLGATVTMDADAHTLEAEV